MRTVSFEGFIEPGHDGKMEVLYLQFPDLQRTSGQAKSQLAVYDARKAQDHELPDVITGLVNDLQRRESPGGLAPWLRAVLVVAPQSSDELALMSMDIGVMIVEADREAPVRALGERVLQQLQRFQNRAASEPAAFERAAQNHASAPNPSGSESPFSRVPAYFDPTLYNQWLGKLSEPWDPQERWDSES